MQIHQIERKPMMIKKDKDSADTSTKPELRFRIMTFFFKWLLWLATPLKLSTVILIKDSETAKEEHRIMLHAARGRLAYAPVMLRNDVDEILQKLTVEEIEYYENRDNDMSIQKSIQLQYAIIAKLRGITLNNNLYIPLLDGSMFYFFLNYFRRTEGTANAEGKAQFTVGMIQKSLTDNCDYKFVYTETDNEKNDFANKPFYPQTIIDTLQAKQLYHDWENLTYLRFIHESPNV